jgi:peptide/nickel transport system ATP-binding protein
MSLLEVQDVRLRFGRVQALRGVSLAIDPGEIVTVVGESGCGKSTLGRVVLGLQRPDSGEVRLNGESIWAPEFRWTDDLRLQVTVVHQDSYASLNPLRRVEQTLAAPLRRHLKLNAAQTRARVLEALNSVGLQPAETIAARYPFQLSGGQRQRVSIARANLLGPRLIVADEPVSAIDASLRLAVLDLMRELNEQGVAFLYVTHDLATSRHVARNGGRMIVMYLGQIVEQGIAAEVLDRPSHPYLQALLAALPPLDPREARTAKPLPLRSLDMPDPSAPPTGCSFHDRCPYATQRCSAEEPLLREIFPGHRVACHYAPLQVQPPGAAEPPAAC